MKSSKIIIIFIWLQQRLQFPIITTTNTFHLCFTGLFFWNYSKLDAMRTSWLAGASSDAECPSFTQPTPPNENHQYNQIITCCIICLNSLQLKDTNNDNTDTSFWWTDSVLLCPSIKRWSCLTCLLRTSGLRTERPRKTKLGTEVAHITRDWDTTFKVKGQSSRSPGRFTYRGVNVSGSCSSERGNVLAVGTYCYVVVCRRGGFGSARRFDANRCSRGAGAYCGGRLPTARYSLLQQLNT